MRDEKADRSVTCKRSDRNVRKIQFDGKTYNFEN